MKLERLRRALREHAPVRDEDFDAVYPLPYQRASARYWTPVETARRAADLLVGEGARRVLDVGAGVGKFCLVGAACARRATFTGIEQRSHLVEAAREAIRALGAARVTMIHGRLDEISTAPFDAFYFYNPFAENIFGPASRLDDTVALSRTQYEADVRRSVAMLGAARPGTRVVTFYGFGGAMPRGYDLVHAEYRNGGTLQLWLKSAP